MSTAAEEPSGVEVPSHRACAHCRSQKVRCIVDESDPDVCQRCARSGRRCVFTPLQKRKQRKRTDTRVAELEREMRTMRALLKNKEQPSGHESTRKGNVESRPAGIWFEENAANAVFTSHDTECCAAQLPNRDPPKQHSGPGVWPSRFQERQVTEIKDVIDNGNISMATARQLFDTYRKDLLPHYPMVAVPDSASADEFRQAKPTLFLAIIAAAAGKEAPDLSAMLDQEILHTYATRILVRSEKSLELIQALLISAAWYHPPHKFGQLKYYEYIRMAATMAMDTGIGVRRGPARGRFGVGGANREVRRSTVHPLEDATNPDLSMTPRSRDASPDSGNLESRRTFLACYAICAGVSLSLRRPSILRVTSYVRECLEYLQQSSNAVPSDRSLVAWARLTMIGEEINSCFSYDDPGGIASITDLKTQFILKDLANRLDKWYMSIPEVDMNGSLTISYWTFRLYCHEIALHVDHSPEDFKAPYQMGVIHPWDGEEIPTQVLADAISECITCSHNILNTFLSMDVESLRGLPVVSFVRVSFAAFVITKLCVSAAHIGSRIGRVLDRSSLKAESFMDRAILHVQAVLTQVRCRVPAVFLALLFKLRAWCMNPKMLEHPDGNYIFTLAKGDKGKLPPKQDSQQRAPVSVDVSRMIELGSDEETVPRTSPDSQVSLVENVAKMKTNMVPDTASNLQFDLTPQSQDTEHNSASNTTLGVNVQRPVPTQMPTTTGLDMLQSTPYSGLNDQMELDQNFFSVFGDVSHLSADGLTGFDDWSSLPPDFMYIPENMNWPAGSVDDRNRAL